jgi:hypothetical protein
MPVSTIAWVENEDYPCASDWVICTQSDAAAWILTQAREQQRERFSLEDGEHPCPGVAVRSTGANEMARSLNLSPPGPAQERHARHMCPGQ